MELDYVAKAKTKRNHEKTTETNVNLFTNMDEVEYSSERQRSRSRRRSLKIDVIPVIIIVLLVLLAVASYMLYTAISSEDKGTTNVNTKEEISSLSPRLCGNRSSMCNQGKNRQICQYVFVSFIKESCKNFSNMIKEAQNFIQSATSELSKTVEIRQGYIPAIYHCWAFSQMDYIILISISNILLKSIKLK